LGKEEYITLWKGITDEFFQDINGVPTDSAVVQKKLEARNFLYMATRKVQNQVRILKTNNTINNNKINS